MPPSPSKPRPREMAPKTAAVAQKTVTAVMNMGGFSLSDFEDPSEKVAIEISLEGTIASNVGVPASNVRIVKIQVARVSVTPGEVAVASVGSKATASLAVLQEVPSNGAHVPDSADAADYIIPGPADKPAFQKLGLGVVDQEDELHGLPMASVHESRVDATLQDIMQQPQSLLQTVLSTNNTVAVTVDINPSQNVTLRDLEKTLQHSRTFALKPSPSLVIMMRHQAQLQSIVKQKELTAKASEAQLKRLQQARKRQLLHEQQAKRAAIETATKATEN